MANQREQHIAALKRLSQNILYELDQPNPDFKAIREWTEIGNKISKLL